MAKKKAYRFYVYVLARAGAWLLGILPRHVLLAVSGFGGRIGYRLISRQRNRIFENLSLAFPEKTPAEIHRTGEQVMEHVAESAAEILLLPRWTRKRIDQLVDLGGALETYKDLLRERKGIISITAHIGNWELLAAVFGILGFEGAVIARRIYYEPYNRWIVSIRRSVGITTVYREDSAREIIRRLGANQIIGILPDQDIDSLSGVFVPFFGREAYTPDAPVRLSLASGAPILVNFMIRLPGGRYRFLLGKVIRPKVETNRGKAVKEYTALWMQEMEKIIRMYPEQWAWMHDRWKTRPEHLRKQGKEKQVSL